jgi:hypothetical protein
VTISGKDVLTKNTVRKTLNANRVPVMDFYRRQLTYSSDGKWTLLNLWINDDFIPPEERMEKYPVPAVTYVSSESHDRVRAACAAYCNSFVETVLIETIGTRNQQWVEKLFRDEVVDYVETYILR